MISPMTQIINDASDVVTHSLFCAGIGYLITKVVKHIDPKVAMVCGASAGAIKILFFSKESNDSSTLVGLAALVIVPLKLCEYLEYSTNYQTTCAITAVCIISSFAVRYFLRIGASAFDS